MSTLKQHPCVRGPLRECRSIRSGASGLPYFCTPLVCISAVIGLLAVWRHNKPKPKNQWRARMLEDFAANWSAVPLTAQAHRRSGCMGGTVPPASLRFWKLIPVAAPVRSCAPFLRCLKTSFGWTMAMAAVRMVGLAATLWVCLGELNTRRCDAYIIILRAPGLPCDGAFILHLGWVRPSEWRRGWTRSYMRACERETRWQEGRRADLADPPWRHAATPDLPTSLHMLCPLVAHSLWCIIQHQCFDARRAPGSASCLLRACEAFHDTILNLFNIARSCLPCMLLANWCIHSTHFRKGMLLNDSSAVLDFFCSSSFFLDFVFVFWQLSFVISTFDGLLGNFCLKFPYSKFSRFWEFLLLVACCEFSVFENLSFGLDRPRPLETYDWRAAASTLVDLVLTAAISMHRWDLTPILPPTHHPCMQPPYTTHSHLPHGMSANLTKLFSRNIPLRFMLTWLKAFYAGGKVYTSRMWISNPGALPIIASVFPLDHSLSVCLFLWVCVVCVYFLLYLSF